ncbi:hypothetical protein [Soonwooa purpurea]
MENITIKDILTTYWSQFTLLIFGIGYLIKIALDTRYKKSEINHNLFQQRKLDSLNNFFLTYSQVHQIWYDFPVYSASRGKFSATELDEMIFPSLNELKRNVLELKIYFDKGSHDNFEEILQSFFKLNGKLKAIVFNSEPQNNPTLLANFEILKDEYFSKNEKLLNKITTKVKTDFNK